MSGITQFGPEKDTSSLPVGLRLWSKTQVARKTVSGTHVASLRSVPVRNRSSVSTRIVKAEQVPPLPSRPKCTVILSPLPPQAGKKHANTAANSKRNALESRLRTLLPYPPRSRCHRQNTQKTTSTGIFSSDRVDQFEAEQRSLLHDRLGDCLRVFKAETLEIRCRRLRCRNQRPKLTQIGE